MDRFGPLRRSNFLGGRFEHYLEEDCLIFVTNQLARDRLIRVSLKRSFSTERPNRSVLCVVEREFPACDIAFSGIFGMSRFEDEMLAFGYNPPICFWISSSSSRFGVENMNRSFPSENHISNEYRGGCSVFPSFFFNQLGLVTALWNTEMSCCSAFDPDRLTVRLDFE